MMNLIEFCIASDNLNRAIDYEEKYKDLQQRIDKAIELVENVYNSLENVDKPIMFYENILEILKGDKNEKY